MRILDKYILKRVISGYLFILFIFVSLFLFIDLSTNLSDFINAKPPFGIIISYYFNMLPFIMLTVSRYALLISVLFVIGELNKNNEILSMRAAGISILHLSFPILFFSLFISFFSLFAQERILTSSQKRIEDIRIQFIKKDFAKAHEEKRLYFATPNKVLFAETFSPKTATLTNVKIFHKNDSEYITKQTFALSISYTQGAWEGKDVMEYAIDEEGAFIGAPFRWDKKVIELDQSPQELLVRKNLLASTSSLKNLRQEIKRLRKIHASKELDKLIIKYNQRLSTPFSHIFLIVGILPLALEIKKRKTSFSALALGFIFGLFYYCFDQFSIVLGGSDFIIPILSAWVAPLFFVTVGLTGLVLIR